MASSTAPIAAFRFTAPTSSSLLGFFGEPQRHRCGVVECFPGIDDARDGADGEE